MYIVNNKPEYTDKYRYIVARDVDGQLWFWGAYNDPFKALKAAEEINGIIIRNEEKEN